MTEGSLQVPRVTSSVSNQCHSAVGLLLQEFHLSGCYFPNDLPYC